MHMLRDSGRNVQQGADRAGVGGWRLFWQVVVHNLPWTCTWQNLKDAFAANTQNIERANVIIDSTGRSRRARAGAPAAMCRHAVHA
jgi:hypothetical protein